MYLFELVPPINQQNNLIFYSRFEQVMNATRHVSIVSKPSNKISGFDKSIKLVECLREKQPDIRILFHLTCRDLNKSNIEKRLQTLKEYNVQDILVVSGDGYSQPPDDISYEDSLALLDDIAGYRCWFQTIGVAGYPGGDMRRSFSNDQECERLRLAIQLGATTVYTQCIFDWRLFQEFKENMLTNYADVEVIPSVALFKSFQDLERVVKLTRVRTTGSTNLFEHLKFLNEEQSEAYCFEYLIRLCSELSQSRDIVICAFGKYDFGASIIRELSKKQGHGS